VEPLKIFSKAFIDTSQFFNSFNKYLDALSQVQTARDQELVLNKMMEGRKNITESMNEEEKLMAHTKPPYEIEWNQYEKLRMQADADLLRTNNTLARMLSRDAGILMGYELASRMSVK
jgi:ATPase subunit of ABC transporter with duplicated ATPase domains